MIVRSPTPEALRDTASPVSRRALLRAGFVCVAGGLLPACSEVAPAPRAIKWGRDLCEFCHMVFGDKRYVAQIWNREMGRAQIYDDFGCAVQAAVERDVLNATEVSFWVNDETKPDVFLDAREAMYRAGARTPMGHGYAPGATPAYTLDFAVATQAIRDKTACEHKG